MTDKELQEIISDLQYVPEERRDRAMKIVLKAASDSFDLKVAKKRLSERGMNVQYGKGGSVKFTDKEMEQMPDYMKKLFIYDNKIVPYRYHNGVYEARYRRDGITVTAASKDYSVMKEKFIKNFAVMIEKTESEQREKENSKYPLLKDYLEEWLNDKQASRKDTTNKRYRTYARLYINDGIGQMHVNEITRQDVQQLLNGMQDRGLNSSAEQVMKLLKSVFKRIAFDFKIETPMQFLELAPFDVGKGHAFTKDDEKTIISFCENNPKYGKLNSAILLLLYTGMRVGELKSVTHDDTYIYCVSEKTRQGCADVIRKIPISPMLKKVLHLINIDDVKTVTQVGVLTNMKRIFPERHTHELRYTFITRAKECGINPEVVMLWDGHAQDKDCVASRVDRGYTDFSEDYLLSEIKKYDYDL